MDEEISFFNHQCPLDILKIHLGPFNPLTYCEHIFSRLKKFSYHFGDDKYKYIYGNTEIQILWHLLGVFAQHNKQKKLAHLSTWQKNAIRKDIYEKTLGKFIRILLRWKKFSELLSLITFIKYSCDEKTYSIMKCFDAVG